MASSNEGANFEHGKAVRSANQLCCLGPGATPGILDLGFSTTADAASAGELCRECGWGSLQEPRCCTAIQLEGAERHGSNMPMPSQLTKGHKV